MTDEQWFREVTTALDPTNPKRTREAVFGVFRRIQLAESERAAGVVDEARDYIVRHRLGYKIADALRECRDEILRTSPGKVADED